MDHSDLQPLNLSISFPPCGEEDVDFRRTLLTLMIGGMRELMKAPPLSFELKDVHIFRKAVHKARSIMRMLNDPDFDSRLAAMRTLLENGTDDQTVYEKIGEFNRFCKKIIEGLEKELETMRQ